MSTVIAFVGASGSGKTRLVEALTMADGSRCPAVMRVDDYYRDLSHLDFASRETINFDHPDAIEFNRLAADLGQLKSGVSVHAPVYDFTQHTRSNVTQIIESAELVILEGVLAMAEVATRALIDRLVFVDTPLDTCLSRRITRDAHERGRTEASVRPLSCASRVIRRDRQVSSGVSTKTSRSINARVATSAIASTPSNITNSALSMI